MTASQPLARLARYGSRTVFHLNSRARALLPRCSDGRIRVTIEPTKGQGVRIRPATDADPGARVVHSKSGQIVIPFSLIPVALSATWALHQARGGALIGARQENE